MSFALVFAGVVFGFVLAFVMLIQKIWDLRDRLEDEKYKARFYKHKYNQAKKQAIEWDTIYTKQNTYKV